MSDLSERLLQQILQQQQEHGQELAAVKQAVDTTNTRLFGNGQPGILSKQDERLDVIEEDFAKMQGRIKTSVATFTGGATVLVFIIKALLTKFLGYVIK